MAFISIFSSGKGRHELCIPRCSHKTGECSFHNCTCKKYNNHPRQPRRSTIPRCTKKPKEKKQIDQYDHKEASRANNPPVGLVTPETDRDAGKKTYAYDPHINPSLQFDPQRSQIEQIIDDAIAAETIENVKAALLELKKLQAPYLNWAEKAERTSFDLQTVSPHVHERIDPRTIIGAVRKRHGNEKQVLLPFEVGENRRIAVKIVDDRGIESLQIVEVE